MKDSSRIYEWVVVGGGVAGITASEILARNKHDTLLLEKNKSLASETSGKFHEWLHLGSLYTLIPNSKTLRYALGGIDDLIEYYSCFNSMNIKPTENGVDSSQEGWFTNKNIIFRFRLKRRKLVIPWIIGIARSSILIEKIRNHDWLRRRAGEIKIKLKDYFGVILKKTISLLFLKEEFFNVKTPDILMNSRVILDDLVSVAESSGFLEIFCGSELIDINQNGDSYELKIRKGDKTEVILTKNLALANGKNIRDFLKISTYDTYAPIVIAGNVPEEQDSFVNLDYFPSNCINLLNKGDGLGMLGGISFKTEEECPPYIDFIINEHKKLNPSLKSMESYVGVKTEFLFPGEERNYIFNVNSHRGGNLWSLVPGKFSLSFSMAVEFYRRAYGENSTKNLLNSSLNVSPTGLVSEHIQKQIYQKSLGD